MLCALLTPVPVLCALCTSDSCILYIMYTWPLHSVGYLPVTSAFCVLRSPVPCALCGTHTPDPYTLCITYSWLLHSACYLLPSSALCTLLNSGVCIVCNTHLRPLCYVHCIFLTPRFCALYIHERCTDSSTLYAAHSWPLHSGHYTLLKPALCVLFLLDLCTLELIHYCALHSV